MHPTLARFLDVGKALEVLESPKPDLTDRDIAAFVKAAREDPELTAQLKGAKPGDRPGPDAQQALVVLAIRASIERLADDPVLAPLASAAAAALVQQGASAGDVTQMLGTVLLEEGFADDSDPLEFDLEFVRETLATLPALARMDGDQVDALIESFVATEPKADRPLALRAAEALLTEAWGDGLRPLTSEHAQVAVDTLWHEASPDELGRLVAKLTACVVHLEKAGLIGPALTRRLSAAATQSLAALAEGGDDSDEDEDEDDEEPDDGGVPN